MLIGEGDVERVFGFLRDPIEITKRDRVDEGEYIVTWRAQFDKDTRKITPYDVCQLMQTLQDEGEWFKRHFLVARISFMIEGTHNEYASQQRIRHFEVVTRVRQLNCNTPILTTSYAER